MTRKDYEQIAYVLARMVNPKIKSNILFPDQVVNYFVDEFNRCNSGFNEDKFRKAVYRD